MKTTITVKRATTDPARWLVVVTLDLESPSRTRVHTAFSADSEQEALGIVGSVLTSCRIEESGIVSDPTAGFPRGPHVTSSAR